MNQNEIICFIKVCSVFDKSIYKYNIWKVLLFLVIYNGKTCFTLGVVMRINGVVMQLTGSSWKFLDWIVSALTVNLNAVSESTWTVQSCSLQCAVVLCIATSLGVHLGHLVYTIVTWCKTMQPVLSTRLFISGFLTWFTTGNQR